MFNVSSSTFRRLALIDFQPVPSLDRIPPLHLEKSNLAFIYGVFQQQLTISTLWKVLLLALVIANLKNLPLVRLLNAFRFVLRSQRTPTGPSLDQLFQPIITSSKATLMETDFNMHKSNSTYFSDLDVARTHLICTLFSKGIEKFRGGTAGIVNGKVSSFAVALGAVSCTFHRELSPYEAYDMWTRILSWDEKWLYIVTHFVKKGAKISPKEFTLYPRQNSKDNSPDASPSSGSLATSTRSSISGESSTRKRSGIAASALGKLVFKNGRVTIPPEVVLEASGLLPPKPIAAAVEYKEYLTDVQIEADSPFTAPQKATQNLEDISPAEGGTLGKRGSIGSDASFRNELTWELIEAERKRGLKVASLLAAQKALESEFADSEALGVHSDGTGIGGVVATLAQLGHLSNYQLL